MLGFIEAILMYFEYLWYNSKGMRSLSFTLLNIVLLSFRTVIALIIVLLISLGYGIIINDVGKYSSKIGLLSFI